VFLDCGHLPHEEYPEAFTKVVADFALPIADCRLPIQS